jgi:adenine deaminase
MPAPYFSSSKEKISEIMKVALGEAPADLAIVNGDVVNVFTGEVLKKQTVLIKGDIIAYVGDNPPKSIKPSTQIIDASGKTLIPGLIDGHTHIDDQFLVGELVRYSLKGSTTTIITETSAIGSLLGYRGILEFLKAVRNQPVRFFITVPPVISTSPSVNKYAAITPTELRRLLHRKEVLGLGELSWKQVNESNPRLLELIVATVNAGKYLDGHSAGAKDNKLQAYIATGISSCHEPITAKEILERLRLGLFVLIREGVVRKELVAVSKIKDENIDFRNLGISADGIDPRQLINDGYMDFIVRKAINYGFNPVRAIQMATINVARHFGLDFIGGIAPGKLADIAIIPELTTIRAECVIVGGKIAFRDGQVVIEPRKHSYPRSFYNTIRLKRDFSPDDFIIRADGIGKVNVRVIDQVSDLLTRGVIVAMPVTDVYIKIDTKRDLLKVASIDRYWQPGKLAVGFIRGFGLKLSAIATSTTWDGAHISVVGASESDMAQAVNRIRDLGGGTVICSDGKILSELPLPLAGLFSEQPMELIARKYDEIQQTAESLGTRLPDIHMTLQVLATPSIPFLRLCEEGLFDLRQNKFVNLILP